MDTRDVQWHHYLYLIVLTINIMSICICLTINVSCICLCWPINVICICLCWTINVTCIWICGTINIICILWWTINVICIWICGTINIICICKCLTINNLYLFKFGPSILSVFIYAWPSALSVSVSEFVIINIICIKRQSGYTWVVVGSLSMALDANRGGVTAQPKDPQQMCVVGITRKQQ